MFKMTYGMPKLSIRVTCRREVLTQVLRVCHPGAIDCIPSYEQLTFHMYITLRTGIVPV